MNRTLSFEIIFSATYIKSNHPLKNRLLKSEYSETVNSYLTNAASKNQINQVNTAWHLDEAPFNLGHSLF